MKPIGRFDPDLQMFVEADAKFDIKHLWYLRWLAERGKLEHGVAGPSSGELVKDLVNGKFNAAA